MRTGEADLTRAGLKSVFQGPDPSCVTPDVMAPAVPTPMELLGQGIPLTLLLDLVWGPDLRGELEEELRGLSA